MCCCSRRVTRLLWRWRFYGVAPPLDEEWAEVVAHARRHFPHASLSFADLHVAFAEAAIGDDDALQRRIAELQGLARDGRLSSGEVAPILCAATAALGRGDNLEATRVLEAALVDLPRIGGSHAQREIFEDALIVAYLRSGQFSPGESLLRARLVRRPSARDAECFELCSGNWTDGCCVGRAGSGRLRIGPAFDGRAKSQKNSPAGRPKCR